MSPSFRYMTGDSSEHEEHVPSSHEEHVHEDLHTPESAPELAQDLGSVMTDSPVIATIGNNHQVQSVSNIQHE